MSAPTRNRCRKGHPECPRCHTCSACHPVELFIPTGPGPVATCRCARCDSHACTGQPIARFGRGNYCRACAPAAVEGIRRMAQSLAATGRPLTGIDMWALSEAAAHWVTKIETAA